MQNTLTNRPVLFIKWLEFVRDYSAHIDETSTIADKIFSLPKYATISTVSDTTFFKWIEYSRQIIIQTVNRKWGSINKPVRNCILDRYILCIFNGVEVIWYLFDKVNSRWIINYIERMAWNDILCLICIEQIISPFITPTPFSSSPVLLIFAKSRFVYDAMMTTSYQISNVINVNVSECLYAYKVIHELCPPGLSCLLFLTVSRTKQV